MAITDDINCSCSDAGGATYRTLATLRRALLVRLGQGAIATPVASVAEMMDSFLADANYMLYNRFSSLRTERWFSWDLVAGQRTYDLGDNEETCDKVLDPNKITWVGASINSGPWYALACGIPPQLESYDNEGFPQRYEIRQCIEVWPAPAVNQTGQLVIKGNFGLLPFTADGDYPSVDDYCVFLVALANAKAHYRQPDAANYVAQMETLLRNLVAGTHLTKRYIPGPPENRLIYVQPVPTVPFA